MIVRYADNLSSRIRRARHAAVESDERLLTFRSRLLDDSILTDWISDNADKIMSQLNKTGISLYGLVQEAEDVYVSNLEYPESFEIVSISAMDEKTAVVIGTTEMDANLMFLLYRSEYIMTDPPHPFSISNADWSDHHVAVEMEVCLSLRFVFSVSLETDEILDFEVEDQTQLCGYCKHCGTIQYSNAAERCRSCKRPLF